MIKNTLSLLFMILVFYTVHPMEWQQPGPSSAPRQESELLKELDSPSFANLPYEVQLHIFETLLDLSTDAELDKNIAYYSRISHQFYDLAHSSQGKTIIKKRYGNTHYLSALQEKLNKVVSHGSSVNLVKDGINAKNYNGETALMMTTIRSSKQAANLAQNLIFHGADVNLQDNDGDTALKLAAFHLNHLVVQVLLDNGADPNIKNKHGRTALIGLINTISGTFSRQPDESELKLLTKIIEKSNLSTKEDALDFAKRKNIVWAQHFIASEMEK